jgi:hypothetical protein
MAVFNKTKKQNRAIYNDDLGNTKASHVQTTQGNIDEWKEEIKLSWKQTFSPTILESRVPQRFIDMINNVGDEVLTDDGLSKKYDFSNNLVGKVSKEVQIPIYKKEDANYALFILRNYCKEYLKQMQEWGRSYEWNKAAGAKPPEAENIHIAQTWIVSQYKNEYNPWHKHSGHFSGVIYLKIPEKMDEHFVTETKDHYPASGLIEFAYGEAQDMRSDTLMVKPEVGMILIFPSWLKHSVYPFYCDGERRSMSFNAYWQPPTKEKK